VIISALQKAEIFPQEQGVTKLKALRKTAGLTQVQLSQRANVSRFRLCMAETDSLELRSDEIEAINQALMPEMARAARIASEFQGAKRTQQRST